MYMYFDITMTYILSKIKNYMKDNENGIFTAKSVPNILSTENLREIVSIFSHNSEKMLTESANFKNAKYIFYLCIFSAPGIPK